MGVPAHAQGRYFLSAAAVGCGVPLEEPAPMKSVSRLPHIGNTLQ